jgi:predicted dehydrogenase
LAPSLAEVLEMLAAAEEAGRRLAEGFMYRHHGLYKRVREMVEDGTIGELRSYYGCFGFTLPEADAVRRDPATGMGVLNETGCYPISAARGFFGGEPDSVMATISQREGVDWSGSARLQYGDRGTATCDFGYDRHYRCSYSLWGSGGQLRVERAFTPPPDFEPVIHLQSDQPSDVTVPPQNHFTAFIEAFSSAIRNEDAHDLFEDEAREQAMTMEAIRVSAREGRPTSPAELAR